MSKMRLHIVVVSLLYLGSCFHVEVSTKEIEFTGNTSIRFDFQPKRTGTKGCEKATIGLDFKTIHPNGLLLYKQGAAADGDFLLLELAYGAVRCTGMFEREKFDMYFKGHHFNDNIWHSVMVDVTDRQIKLRFDSMNGPIKQLMSSGYVQELTTKNSSISLGMAQPQITDRNNYVGCMRNVRFIDSDYNPLEQSSNCRQKEYHPVQFQSSWSFLKFNTTNPLQHDGGSFRASFTFRTFKSRGSIFSVVTISLKFRLRLDSGRLLCDEVTSDRNTTIQALGSNLNDGEWHSVHATLNGTTKKLEVSLDDEKVKLDYSPPKVFKKTSQLNISLGKVGEEPGFGGCLFNLQLNSHRYHSHDFRKMNSNDTKVNSCELNNPCFPNPCNNDGECAHEGKDPMCTCTREYEGKNCEDSIFKTTCKMYMEQGLTTNAKCILGTDKNCRYSAQCKIRDQMMYTIVQPTKKATNAKVSAGKSDNLHGDDFYVHDIYSEFDFTVGQIERLKIDSEACKQILVFSSSICGDKSFPNKHAFWKYITGESQKEPPASSIDRHTTFNGCTNFTFNLTNKAKLPITSLWFHKKHNSSHFTVGPLECWGSPDEKVIGRDKKEIRKDNKRLEAVCEKDPIPTSAPTTSTTEKHVNDTPSVENGCNNSVKPTSGPCINYSSTISDPSGNPSSVGKAAPGKQTNSTAKNGLPTALTVLLSSLLVVALLIAVKFGLPRFTCASKRRIESRNGDYVASNSHTGRNKHELIETGTIDGNKEFV